MIPLFTDVSQASDGPPTRSARRVMVGRRSDRTGTQAAEAASPGGAGELSSPGGHWQSDGVQCRSRVIVTFGKLRVGEAILWS